MVEDPFLACSANSLTDHIEDLDGMTFCHIHVEYWLGWFLSIVLVGSFRFIGTGLGPNCILIELVLHVLWERANSLV